MSKLKQNSIDRMRPGKDLIRVIHMLQANKSFGITAEAIAQEMEVSIRTVKRWLSAIKDIEPDLSFRLTPEVKGKLWYLPAAKTRASPASADQLASLSAIASLLKTMGYAEYGALLNEMRDGLQANISQQQWNKIDPDLEVMDEAVQVALRPGSKAIYAPSITYQNITATKINPKRVSPLGIILGPRAYLVAHDEEVDALKNYALTGISNLNISDDNNTHTTFDIDAFAHRSFGAFHDGIFEEWKLTFDAKAAPMLEHYEFHPSQETQILEGGEVEIRFSCESVKEIAYECFRWSEHLISIQPDALNQVVTQIINEMQQVIKPAPIKP
jgi:predicted DNA-binding transcriptional regulator YafY